MKEMLRRFWQEEEGMGTVEIVIIIGILVAVALIFRKALLGFVQDLMDKFFDTGNVPGVTDPACSAHSTPGRAAGPPLTKIFSKEATP